VPYTYPTVFDPATVSQTCAQVASLFNEYIAAYKNAAGLATASQVTISDGTHSSQVSDPTLVAEVNAGAQATKTLLEQQYTQELAGLSAYIQAAVIANAPVPV